MAGATVVNQVQLGDSATATQNFVLQTNVDGTMKLGRGVIGAITQDIMTVSALGEVDFPQMIRQKSENGYQKLPGGVIIQWGSYTSSIAASGGADITFPITFPNDVFSAVPGANSGSSDTSPDSAAMVRNLTTSGLRIVNADATAALGSGAYWIAIGH